MSANYSYRRGVLLAAAAVTAVLTGGGAVGHAADRAGVRKMLPPHGTVTFRSHREAYNNGRAAFLQGNYAVALPALEFSAQNGWIPSKFYLAQIFSDNAAPYTDHSRAYNLFREIVETTVQDTDPDDAIMAPILAQSLVALGRYMHTGMSSIGVRRNSIRAAEYFSYAANRLNNPDAQYELAKMLLVGDGIQQEVPLALHFFSLLVKSGHTSAQATMAEILADGRYIRRDMVEALAMIDLALRNAPEKDAFWIAEIHQRIYCGTSPDVKQQASGLVGSWQQKYGRPSPPGPKGDLGYEVSARRECKDGALVPQVMARSHPQTAPAGGTSGNGTGPTLAIEREPPISAGSGTVPSASFGFAPAPRR